MTKKKAGKSEGEWHVVTLPLVVSNRGARVVDQRLKALGQLRNAVLGGLLHRANAMKHDRRYRECAAMPSGAERTAGFKALREEYQLRTFDATSLATGTLQRSKWMPDHVPSSTAQAEALQAFTSVNEWLVGARGKPWFKPSSGQDVAWGASTTTPIHFDAGTNELSLSSPIKRKKLKLKVSRSSEYVNRLVNGGRVSTAAVKREVVRGKVRYFALVRVEGKPYRNAEYSKSVATGKIVGLDAGPSKLAVVDDDGMYSLNRAPAALLGQRRAEQARIRRTQRALDRSRRATNPDCFDDKGRYIKGKKITVRSKAYERAQRKLAAEQRRQRVNRRQDETALARRVMLSGNVIAVENVNYRGWQASRYGKRMGFTAPGALMERIKREAMLMGGAVYELPLGLSLSQYCVCGRRERKELSQRVHNCPDCGLVADRDGLPAWFAKMIVTAGLQDSCGGKELGPLLDRVTAAAEYEPNDPEQIRALGGRLTPNDSSGSAKSALVGSSVSKRSLPGNTHEDSYVVGTPGPDTTRRPPPEKGGVNATYSYHKGKVSLRIQAHDIILL